MLQTIKRTWYQILKFQDYHLGVFSCSVMKWRGFSDRPIHPKHLFDEHRSEYIHGLFRESINFLDIGSGVGTECLLAAKSGANISVGLEKNRQSLTTANIRANNDALNASFVQIDLENGVLPFAANSFDLIHFSNVLEHIINRYEVLVEIKRVKTEGGTVVISIPNSETSWKKKLKAAGLDSRDDPDHKIEYSKSTLVKELKDAGLTISTELMPIIPSWPWNGLIALSAAVSPSFYKRMQKYKREYVEDQPDESIGWVFEVK